MTLTIPIHVWNICVCVVQRGPWKKSIQGLHPVLAIAIDSHGGLTVGHHRCMQKASNRHKMSNAKFKQSPEKMFNSALKLLS